MAGFSLRVAMRRQSLRRQKAHPIRVLSWQASASWRMAALHDPVEGKTASVLVAARRSRRRSRHGPCRPERRESGTFVRKRRGFRDAGCVAGAGCEGHRFAMASPCRVTTKKVRAATRSSHWGRPFCTVWPAVTADPVSNWARSGGHVAFFTLLSVSITGAPFKVVPGADCGLNHRAKTTQRDRQHGPDPADAIGEGHAGMTAVCDRAEIASPQPRQAPKALGRALSALTCHSRASTLWHR
jgi:hypothetical protein